LAIWLERSVGKIISTRNELDNEVGKVLAKIKVLMREYERQC
jgi:hypothetical protein